jgi:hypothetical protein
VPERPTIEVKRQNVEAKVRTVERAEEEGWSESGVYRCSWGVPEGHTNKDVLVGHKKYVGVGSSYTKRSKVVSALDEMNRVSLLGKLTSEPDGQTPDEPSHRVGE